MKKLNSVLLVFISIIVALSFSACKNTQEQPTPNSTPESVIETFYKAWETSDGEAFVALTCEPMWEVEAKSADVSADELKAQLKDSYKAESGSKVYYKILKTTLFEEDDEEFKSTQKWARDRYNIQIEGYAVVRVTATYDDGEPVTENMEVIKYKNTWYAKNILGI